MKNLTITILAMMLSTLLMAQNVNSEKSVIGFSVTNMKVNTVFGTMNGLSGEVTFNPEDLDNSKFSVKIDASTVNTGTDLRDEHLRERESLLNVSDYPVITFESTSIKITKDGYITTGWLTIKDVKKEVNIPFSYGRKDNESALTGDFTINRNDYGIGKGTGSAMIGNEIKINIICIYNNELVSY